MASTIPTIPRLFLSYVEPAIWTVGALKSILHPESITELLPLHLGGRAEFHAHPTPLEHYLALQGASYMLLIAIATVAVLFYGNKQAIKAFVFATVLAKLPQLGSLVYVLGSEGLERWRIWNGGLWVQLIVPLFAFLVKVGYLTGGFGPDQDAALGTTNK